MVFYYLPLGRGDGRGAETREAWATLVAAYDHSLKPPASWLDAQELKGRTRSAAISIWHLRYPKERKLAIWLMSSDEDFERAGYSLP